MSKSQAHRKVLAAVCQYGLAMHVHDLSPEEYDKQSRHVTRLLKHLRTIDADEIANAVRYGMKKVWPFSEEGRTFDAEDVLKHITKARAAWRLMERTGTRPQTGAEALQHLEDIRHER